MVRKYEDGTNGAETIEVSNEQIAANLPVLLHVRRGSESALNQLFNDTNISHDDASGKSRPSSGYRKRWSAAAPMSPDHKDRYSLKKVNSLFDDSMFASTYSNQMKLTLTEEDEDEERDILAPRRTSSVFIRDGSSRLSMQFYRNQAGSKWVDAADRMISNRVFSLSLPRELRKKEPSCSTNSHRTSYYPANYENSKVITLKMDDEALGIHLIPDYDENGNDRGLLVEKIDPGGKVDRDGRISVKDRIIEINDRNLLNQSVKSVEEIFRDSLKSSELKLCIVQDHRLSSKITNTLFTHEVTKKQQPPPVYPRPCVNFLKHQMHDKENLVVNGNTEKTDKSTSQTKKVSHVAHVGSNVLMSTNTRKIGKIIEVELTKDLNSFGFSVTTRDNPIGGNFPIYIKYISPEGPAAEDGRLKCGDRFLSINDMDLTGKTREDVVSELRKISVGEKVKIVVSRQEETYSKLESENDEPNFNGSAKMEKCVDMVDISKKQPPCNIDQNLVFPYKQKEILTFDIPVHDTEKAGLGISVKGKTSTNSGERQGDKEASIDMGIFINSVINGGAASKDGRLRMNDQMLNVNGVSLLNLSNTDAMEILKRAICTEGPKPGTISLTIARKIGSSSTNQKFQRSSSPNLPVESFVSPEVRNHSDQEDTVTPASADNSGNSEHSDSTVIFLPSSKTQSKFSADGVPTRNPVLDRLNGQLPNHNGLRNESYYRATHQTSMMLVGRDVDRLTSPTINQTPNDLMIIEEDPPCSPKSEKNANELHHQRNSTSSTQGTDVTYASQLSLDDGTAFSRDTVFRRSISEKGHATLDAKSTDTYKRNKKIRQEREKQRILENRRLTIGVFKVNSTESVSKLDGNENTVKTRLGPSLGLKKSSSLESLQTMVQEIRMAEGGSYRCAPTPAKVVRGRGCNESFRAAVDRSYETSHLIMDSVAEDGGCSFPPRQLSLNSQLDCKLLKNQPNNQKKKSSLLKGLGSMFRFGKHRKSTTLEEDAAEAFHNNGVRGQNTEEKELARLAAQDEHQRIQKQYNILLQREMNTHRQQEQQTQSVHNFNPMRMYNNAQCIQANNVNINNFVPAANNCNDLNHLRTRQYRYVDRRSLFPPETKEKYYNDILFGQSTHRASFEAAHRDRKKLTEKHRQLPESNRYSHYVNYEEIRNQLNRRQQHYHSQRRDNKEMFHRPVSNFYEYESVQTTMENHSRIPMKPSFLDNNMNQAVQNEFFPSTMYECRNRNYDPRSYQIYSNANLPYQQSQFSPPRKKLFSPTESLYSNIRPLSKSQKSYHTQVTLKSNQRRNTNNNSLGTKV